MGTVRIANGDSQAAVEIRSLDFHGSGSFHRPSPSFFFAAFFFLAAPTIFTQPGSFSLHAARQIDAGVTYPSP